MNHKLKRQLAEDDKTAQIDQDLEMRQDGMFYVRISEKEKGLIPYCPTCWGSDKKLVPLLPFNPRGGFQCPLHKAYYLTSEYREWQSQIQPLARRSYRIKGL